MARTIGNPVTWTADEVGAAGRWLGGAVGRLGLGEAPRAESLPKIRHLGRDDLEAALRAGWDDFRAFRTDVVALCLFYPLIGLALAWFAFDLALLPLLFPVMSGFALIGPLAAVGLYEMSRRREAGEAAGWADAFGVVRAPSFGAIFLLGLFLLALFGIWLLAAGGLYAVTLGPEPPEALGRFVTDMLTTWAGWALIVIGCSVGFLFAVAVLAVSLVSFPLLLDRPVGLPAAIVTSVRVAAESPRAVAAWGLIVAAGLALGTLPAFLGLVVVLPVLGHATWHLYRRAVVPPAV